MEIAILILVIVVVILLGILTFFIFQIWIQSKETKIQLKEIVNSISQIKEELKIFEKEIKQDKSDIIKSIDSYIQNSEIKICDGLESVKNKTNSAIEGLSDSVKFFKDNIDGRIKELDNNLSEKLVNDLAYLTNSYSKNLKEEQSKVLDRFEQTSMEINKKQADILKSITEPLKINLNHND